MNSEEAKEMILSALKPPGGGMEQGKAGSCSRGRSLSGFSCCFSPLSSHSVGTGRRGVA